MADYNSVLNEARQLSQGDKLRLIDALWDFIPPDANIPLHEDWGPELERRVAALMDGTETTIPWETVRAEALARLGHGNTR
ncbi:MAG: addiction module protein [Firmicutes bacterium]|mgnify:CR=1 FL=1|nr:addiction module protein [Bacillota bacterium]